MQGSKIQLSESELELACNAGIILTKNSIISKTIALLGSVEESIAEQTDRGRLFSISPKISRGEYYEGLPYVVLDYPRYSRSPDLCFIRAMFWWGHFFSSTLQLSGNIKTKYIQAIEASYGILAEKEYYIGINTDPWQHHFEDNNYVPIRTLSAGAFQAILMEQEHIKIAAKLPLLEWQHAAGFMINSWNLLAGLIT
ncbi:hypothetical protein [Flavisolibacter ginsengisoli]|jgi:hypothetical protein|uniref:Uncharacterized protein n=1 Tax=Flavisolibacter ginsengisoli DSM 18119 TaxID=1121884 RepID=A0A1M5AU68_9BACT|nr:hypothetical protein [Flavisolibacter ginsengisoli]SHF33773.1 hypothetical protein SAMN02745131_02357 [Flavisolibacter ginsengisoli DSM 18119]